MYTDSVILVPQVSAAKVAATAVLTSDNSGQFTSGKIVTIGSTVYTFRTALSTGPTVPYEVLLGADADASLANLVKAINDSGTEGTHYSVGTVAHPTVSAGAVTSHTVTLTALISGFAANAYATTTDEAKLSFAGATMLSGVGGVLSSAAIGTSGTAFYTDVIDVGMFTELIAFLNVASHGGTSPTLDITSQISPDGVTWTDGDAFTQVTETDSQTIKRITANFGKYMRFKIDLGGTAPRYVLTLSLVGKA